MFSILDLPHYTHFYFSFTNLSPDSEVPVTLKVTGTWGSICIPVYLSLLLRHTPINPLDKNIQILCAEIAEMFFRLDLNDQAVG